MANFIQKTLEENEKVIFQGRLHWSFNFRYTVWGTILFLAGIGGCIAISVMAEEGDNNSLKYIGCLIAALIGFCLIGFGYFIRSKTEFAITDTRFIQKDGIFNIKMTEIPLFKVETVNFYQTMLDRFINTGSIELVGSGGTNHRVDYVQRPFEVRNIITTQMKSTKGVEEKINQGKTNQEETNLEKTN